MDYKDEWVPLTSRPTWLESALAFDRKDNARLVGQHIGYLFKSMSTGEIYWVFGKVFSALTDSQDTVGYAEGSDDLTSYYPKNFLVQYEMESFEVKHYLGLNQYTDSRSADITTPGSWCLLQKKASSNKGKTVKPAAMPPAPEQPPSVSSDDLDYPVGLPPIGEMQELLTDFIMSKGPSKVSMKSIYDMLQEKHGLPKSMVKNWATRMVDKILADANDEGELVLENTYPCVGSRWTSPPQELTVDTSPPPPRSSR